METTQSEGSPVSVMASLLRLCLVDGSTFLLGRTRHSGRQSEHHFETVLFSRGRGVGEFSLFDALCLSGLTVKC